MIVTNKTNTVQTAQPTTSNENVQKTNETSNFSQILNEEMKAKPNTNFSSLEIKILSFSEAQMENAISLDEYLDRMNPVINDVSSGITVSGNASTNVAGLGNSEIFSTSKYDDLIVAESKKYGVDPLIIKSIIKHESGFNANVVSPAGASGLMQLMPSNIRHYGVTDPFDAAQNIAAGVQHFKAYSDMYDGDLTLTLAAYNAGPGNVKKYGGVPPFKETQNYIERVLGTYNKASQA